MDAKYIKKKKYRLNAMYRGSRIPQSTNPKSMIDRSDRSLHSGETSLFRVTYSEKSKPSIGGFKVNTISTSVRGKGLFNGVTPRKENRNTLSNGIPSTQKSAKSSFVANRGHQKDTRPLSDRSYQDKVISKLIEFLTENNYPYPIPPKFMISPSKNDVIKIFEFLFSQFDPSFVVVPLEVKIPELMKWMKYPFLINKSCLISFSSRQSIGNLLGIFEYLIDCSGYANGLDMDNIFPQNFDDEVNIQQELLQMCFNTVEEDREEQLMNLAIKVYGTEEDIQKLQKEKEKLQEESDKLAQEIKEKENYPAYLDAYESKIEDYRVYHKELENLIKKYEDNLESLNKSYEENLQLKEQLIEKQAELEKKIEEQTYSYEEIEYARERQKHLECEIKEEVETINDLKRNIRSISLEIKKDENKLTKLHDKTISKINALKDILSTSLISTYAPGLISFFEKNEWKDVILYFEKTPSKDDLTNDKRKQLANLLHSFRMLLVECIADLDGKAKINQQQKLRGMNLAAEELERCVRNEEENFEILDKNLQSFQQQCAIELRERNEEIASYQQKLSEMQNIKSDLDDALAIAKQKLDEATNEYKENQHKLFVEKKEKIETWEKSLNNLLESLDKRAQVLDAEVSILYKQVKVDDNLVSKLKKKCDEKEMRLKERNP